MARKKDLSIIDVNRNRILEVAKKLFYEKGIDNTSVDEIARTAQMSKSTMYVYFKSKEEIANCISLEAMQYLYNNIKNIVGKQDFRSAFMKVCYFLVEFKEKYPASFELLIGEIDVEEESLEKDSCLREIYEVGERLNNLLYQLFQEKFPGKEEAAIRMETFSLWGSIYGVIALAENKEKYIKKRIKLSKKEFLERSFISLYKAIENREEAQGEEVHKREVHGDAGHKKTVHRETGHRQTAKEETL